MNDIPSPTLPPFVIPIGAEEERREDEDGGDNFTPPLPPLPPRPLHFGGVGCGVGSGVGPTRLPASPPMYGVISGDELTHDSRPASASSLRCSGAASAASAGVDSFVGKLPTMPTAQSWPYPRGRTAAATAAASAASASAAVAACSDPTGGKTEHGVRSSFGSDGDSSLDQFSLSDLSVGRLVELETETI